MAGSFAGLQFLVFCLIDEIAKESGRQSFLRTILLDRLADALDAGETETDSVPFSEGIERVFSNYSRWHKKMTIQGYSRLRKKKMLEGSPLQTDMMEPRRGNERNCRPPLAEDVYSYYPDRADYQTPEMYYRAMNVWSGDGEAIEKLVGMTRTARARFIRKRPKPPTAARAP